MKTVNVTFTDEEFQKILEAKGNVSWHDFILKMSERTRQFMEWTGLERRGKERKGEERFGEAIRGLEWRGMERRGKERTGEEG
ncbi:MAG: hypothetical protein ACUVT9_05390 [Candidatus Bathycorpusculaceae bacterium]